MPISEGSTRTSVVTVGNETSAVDYRALLEEERIELVGKLAELGFGDGNGLTYDPNFADSSQVTAERSETETLAGKLRDALDEVEQALSKLESGTYGACESCGRQIDPVRLEAKPAARRCIECASKH
jgi:RNA polymerase-binding transcription factor DksA